MPKNQHSSDLKGASQLAIDAVKGITGIVETLHATILKAGLGEPPEKGATTGIAGFVYQLIHATADITGKALELFFNAIQPLLEDLPTNEHREAVVSTINGVLGDYLVNKENPLAIQMNFRIAGEVMAVKDIARRLEEAKTAGKQDKLLFMVHGLCMNDLQWALQGHNHGDLLADELGFTPVYLHYNTGRHISINGQLFSNLLEELSAQLPESTEWLFLAHSMGGLVSRSAYHQAKQSGATWTNRLQKIIFLGTPHQGALLEKGGNWIDMLLDINPYTKPFSKLGKIRSAGITDMRFSSLMEEDWKDKDRFAFGQHEPVVVPLPTEAQCYAVASSTSAAANSLHDESIGDGLVTISSALGKHQKPQRQLQFPPENCWTGYGIDHLRLLSNPEVYKVIKAWFSPA